MGGWVGGQADFVMVPYADFNLLKFPDKAQAMAKIRDLTMLSDILPTGFHGAVSADVGVGSTVYIAGAGPVGLAAAASAQILGAATVLIGDMNPERLAHAKSVGFEPVDLTKSDRLEELIEQILGVPEVDASIDAVGFEARGHGTQHTEEAPATVLNALMTITRAGGAIGIPGLYVTEDPGSADKAAQQGNLRMSPSACPLSSACEHRTLLIDALQQLLPRLHERRCAVALQLFRECVDIDASSRKACDHRFGVAAVFGHRTFELAVLRERV